MTLNPSARKAELRQKAEINLVLDGEGSSVEVHHRSVGAKESLSEVKRAVTQWQ